MARDALVATRPTGVLTTTRLWRSDGDQLYTPEYAGVIETMMT